jgi:hypothetical protein
VIAAFNLAHSVQDVLAAHRYTRRGNRWMSPTSSSGLAGTVIIEGRVYSHHASDPLSDGHAHDAFDLFRILDHAGDTRAAIKAAAEELGMGSTASAKALAGASSRRGTRSSPEDCESRVLVARGDTLPVKPVRWMWDGWLAHGKLHVLAGAPGTGKSTIAIAFAAVVTTGGPWPDGMECAPGHVLVWSDEDDPADTLLPRFLAAGGDPRRLTYRNGHGRSQRGSAVRSCG